MSGHNVEEIMDGLNEDDLSMVRQGVEGIVEQRMQGSSLLAWEHMSTLELIGTLAIIQLRLDRLTRAALIELGSNQ